MFPEDACWYLQFARNSIVLAYTDGSRYTDKITEDNWYEILGRDGVKFGFSNPNDDPCGYRSQIVIQLSEFYYHDPMIYEDLIEENTNLNMRSEDGVYILMVPKSQQMKMNTEKIMVRSMEMELIAGLEIGEIDYLFIYESVAEEHGFEFLELPPQIDLSEVEYGDIYEKVKVQLADGNMVSGSPIVYGMTIPENAPNRDMAIEFTIFLIEDGNFSSPIIPPVVSDIEKIPAELKVYLRV